MQPLVVRLKPALYQIADHCNQFIQIFALRRHFWIMADGDERVLVPLNLKSEFFLHAASLAHEMNFDKGEAEGEKETSETVIRKIFDELPVPVDP
jgi:hypothetical protein